MADRIFKQREQAIEASYFRRQDACLLQALRANAKLDEITIALAEKLAVDNADLLLRVRKFGVTHRTAPAFLLLPLIQVAWAEGRIGRRTHRAIVHAAGARGIVSGSAAYNQLLDWLSVRPTDALFKTALEVISYGLAVLPPNEREEHIDRIIKSCSKIQSATRSIGNMFCLMIGISNADVSDLSAIAHSLRTPRGPNSDPIGNTRGGTSGPQLQYGRPNSAGEPG